MTSRYVKHHLHLCLFFLFSCDSPTSSLQQKEKALVGNWKKAVDNGQVKGWYMELHEDRTGVFGPTIKVGDKFGLYMPFLINQWKIQNDTLSFQFKMQPGYSVYGPDGKEVGKSDKPSYAHYIVWEVSDTAIVLEDLDQEFQGTKDRLTKSKRLKVLSN